MTLTDRGISDYCIAAFAIILIISVFQWIVDGRKNYTGPRLEMTLDGLENISTEPEQLNTHENDHEKRRV